jgi:glycine oxidase
MKSWDVIIVGGGIIGLSLAISLRKQGLRVLIVERGEPGREASHAAAGMLAGSGGEIPPALRVLAKESARIYPEFVHELEDESGLRVDLRDQGTILISSDRNFPESAEEVFSEQLHALEPELAVAGRGRPAPHKSSGAESSEEIAGSSAEFSGAYLSERSVDPRALVAAAIKAAHHREVDISSGSEVTGLLVAANRVTGVETSKTSYSAPIVVNCAGAWAGCIGTHRFPVRPVKGQILSVVGGPDLRHVVRAENVYLVPRTDGRLVIGSTLEEVGYDKRTEINTIQRLLHAAVEVIPGLAQSKIHNDWAGLRPGTPDELPILGESEVKGYFIATGHYRDGILLAPITAQVMTDVILAKAPGCDLASFSPERFRSSQ